MDTTSYKENPTSTPPYTTRIIGPGPGPLPSSAAAANRNSVFRLLRVLTGDTRTLLRQEVQLAKTEISEKLSVMGRNAASLAVGGFVAYAGLVVFLIGLGWLVGWALEKAGLEPAFAAFLGLAIIGLLVAGTGGILVLKGIKTLSKEPMAPQRTIHTLQELRGLHAATPTPQPEPDKHASSADLQARVEATENRMGETLDELGRRLSPQHINAQVKEHIQANPYRSGLIAVGAGLLSGLMLRRKMRHS